MPEPLLAYPDGADAAVVDPAVVAEMVGLSSYEVLVGWTTVAPPWMSTVTGRAIMVGPGVRAAVAAGHITYVPVRLSAVPRLVEHTLVPDVTVVAGLRRGSELAYRGTVGWGPAACRAARAVVVEVDDDAHDLGAPVIEGPIVGVVPRPPLARPLPPRGIDDVDRTIGALAAALIPAGATIQAGPGGIADAIVAAIDRPVRIHSGLLTDAMAGLAGRGLLDGVATAGYVWGGAPIAALADAGRLRLRPVEETHSQAALERIDGFVGCNTALQVGLDGSVNVERVGGRTVAGIGGHADYCAAAARSPEGLSIIALRSTTPSGASTIVATVDVVSTPRCDVDVVVTEHGVADLRGLGSPARRLALASVAAPAHRGALTGADTQANSKTHH